MNQSDKNVHIIGLIFHVLSVVVATATLVIYGGASIILILPYIFGAIEYKWGYYFLVSGIMTNLSYVFLVIFAVTVVKKKGIKISSILGIVMFVANAVFAIFSCISAGII